MLTVDYDRLGLRAGERVLDMGAGGGRHAFEVLRRGAHVTALDLDAAELKDVMAVMGAMHDAGEVPEGASAGSVNGSALDLPFADGTFDRIITSEVLEHIGDDRRAISELTRVLRPGGTMAVTVPRWFPELVNWALSDEYHAPYVVGGHLRIYREGVLRGRLEAAGLEAYDRHHAHGLHAPYWWLKCAVGVENAEHPLVKRYHDLLVLEMTTNPRPVQLAERVLQPLIGKSLVLYARKPLASR
jgi:SAM-dependent methyltransferase